MKINVKDVREEDAWTREVDIEVDGAEIQVEIDDNLKKLRKGIDLPGFRKGKVPLHEVRARFGREVRAEVLERVVSDAIQQAVEENDLKLVSSPRVEDLQFESGQPLTFKAMLDVRPPIELGDYAGLKIDKVVRPIGDEEIDRLLEELRMSRAQLEEVDRAAEVEDIVTVHVTMLGPGQVPIVGTRQEDIRLLLTEQALPPHWLEALSGRRAGETITVAAPSREGQEQQPGMVQAGGDERYEQLELIKVETRNLPEVTDAFAQEVAQLDTVDELRERVRQNLAEEEDRRARREVERSLLDRLAEPLKLEIPDRIVRKAADDLYESALRQHPELGDEGREKLAVEAEKEAARRMRHELVVAEVGRREEIAVTREEAQEAFQHLAQGGMEPPEDEASRARMIENLRDSIYERKVLNLLADRADVQVIEGARGKSRIVTPFDS